MKFVLACLVSLSVHASESQDIIDSLAPFQSGEITDQKRIHLSHQIRALEDKIRFLHHFSNAERNGNVYTNHPVCKSAPCEIDFRPEKFMRVLAVVREEYVRDFNAARGPDWNKQELAIKIYHLGLREREFLQTIYGQLYFSHDPHFLTSLFGLDKDVFMPSSREMNEASGRGRILLQRYVDVVRRHVHDLAEKSLKVLQTPDTATAEDLESQADQWDFHLETMTYHVHRGVEFAYRALRASPGAILIGLGRGLRESLRRAEQEFKFRRDGEGFANATFSGIDLNDRSAPSGLFDVTFLYNGGRHTFQNLESTFQLHRDVLILQYVLTAGSLIGQKRLTPVKPHGLLRLGKQKTSLPINETVEQKLWNLFFDEVGDITGDLFGLCQGILVDQRQKALP